MVITLLVTTSVSVGDGADGATCQGSPPEMNGPIPGIDPTPGGRMPLGVKVIVSPGDPETVKVTPYKSTGTGIGPPMKKVPVGST